MKALAISALLALIGTTAAYRLFPKVDGLGKYPATISRGEAITRARQLAARYGRNVDGWTTWVDGNRDENTAEFLRTMSDHPLVRTTRPYKYVLVFTRGPFRVRVEMSGDGVPLEFSYRNGRRPEFSGQALTKEQEAGVLADFAGPDAGRFVQVSSVNRGAQGHLTTWEWKVEDQPDLIRQLEVTSSPDGIRRAAIRNEFSAAMLQRVAAAFVGSGFNAVVISVLLVVGITLTNALFFAGLARGQIKPGPALRMFAALMAIWAVGFWGSADLDGLLIGANAANQPPPEQLLRALGVAMATMGLFPAMWAVGRWLMRSAGLERWRTWDALLEGRVWRRAVGRSVACGFLLGVALLAIPMSLCAARIFARSETTLSSPASLAAGAPVALPLSFLMPWDLSGIFFLLVPLASMAYGRKWVPERLRWLLLSVLAVVLVAFVRKPVLDYGGNFVAAGILAAAFLAIYHWLDLLAVMMAEVGYSAALVAVYFLNQHSPAIQTNGIVVAAAYGMVALAGVAALLWAPELEAASEEAVVVIAAEREVLQNEFAMAREAQQRLLAPVPARLDGFSLAASCHPARDVGGDLYDFFRYPDGTYGMCVADVSGKGVPAALYMTMTKGILIAASRDPADLAGLASELNAQLYAAGRKKVFVTMAMGRLDVRARKLEYLRAGHNSILWRHAKDGSCEYRQPRGVGLGLTANRLFERATEVETLALEPGDAVVFYSDGITEAMNSARELFGEDRLSEVVQRYGRLDAAGLESAILREVRSFMAGEPPHDDMTLLIVKA